MGQATRLNLRMQRELKLLQTDPPPGVSVRLADDDTTLTNINAKIEGPEGTVYANGFFNIKILIPERYPFHPPNVTFSTPIYHPNIDDGGRICLDILNLPPKGAWRPSLNISTVLTSIGLLLSEPNPDDGLICETSREYKYNRHSFDQKARSWTERYAKAGGGTVADAESQVVEANTNLKNDAEHVPGSSKKICSISRKLSLQSVNSDGKENIAPGGGGTSISRKLSLPRSQITAASSEPQPLHKSRVVANKEQLEGSKIDDDATRGPSSMLSNILNAGVGLLNKQQKFEKTGQQVLTIIVPDSESEDEGAGPTRSRLSLKRMRLKAERNAR